MVRCLVVNYINQVSSPSRYTFIHCVLYLFFILTIFWKPIDQRSSDRSSHREVFLGKVVLKICSKFSGEHPCRSAISKQLYWNHTLEWVFSSIFSEHLFLRNLWTAASVPRNNWFQTLSYSYSLEQLRTATPNFFFPEYVTNRRWIQNPVKYLKWSFSLQYLKAENG